MVELEFSQALEAPNQEFSFSCSLPLNIAKEALYPNEVLGDANVFLKYCVDYDANLRLLGYLNVPCKFMCDRCGAWFEKNLFLDIEEKISPKMSEEDDLSYNMPKINLEEVLSSYVILNFPTKILCREDCKGLCPNCGANLNDGECECYKNRQ